jgi:hypothetical protein
MDSQIVDKLKHITNTEVIRRLLIKYFVDKGFVESFDRQMYPGIIQDLPMVIPALANKVEVVPHAEDIDTALGKAVIGWNLFVLGNQRMYLGETHHNNLQDLARQIHAGVIMPEGTMASARRQTTPKRIVSFLTRVLSDHQSGYVDLAPTTRPPSDPGQAYGGRNTMNGMPQQFFTRSGYGT